MRKVRLGASSLEVSAIAMGTWQAGKAMWSGVEDSESIAAIRAAYDAGITTFDTAETYGGGHSEVILGEALRSVRSNVIYSTKVLPHNLAHDQLVHSCEESLKRLGTDWIDLYQIHWPSGALGTKTVPIEESMRALLSLKDQGKIRAIGVSNFSREQLKEAASYGEIVSVQAAYSLFWRHVEAELQPYCIQNGLALLAYSPMAQGLLTGRFGARHVFEPGDHRVSNKLFAREHSERIQAALDAFRPIAASHECTLAELALAWVLSHSNTCAIAGARTVEQALSNASAISVRLSESDLADLDRISRRVSAGLGDDPIMWNF